MDWTLKIGGAAGQGLQVIGSMLSRAFVRSGLFVFTIQDSESRIRGGHNFVQMRVSDRPVNALSTYVDVLVAFDVDSIEQHMAELCEDGVAIFDPDMLKDMEVKERMISVPLGKLTAGAGGEKIMINSTAVGAVLGMVHFPLEPIAALFKEEFADKGQNVIDANMKVLQAGYDFTSANCQICPHRIEVQQRAPQMILSGNQALALGAMAAGLRFLSAYPMSPSTSILEFIAAQAVEHGIIVEQAEDEISAINMAIGASYAGVRAMTTTSGGGLCLMVEGIGLAGMTETPVVIVDAQRPGPSTGLPTRTEQGDLLFLIHASHGEFPRAILAPGDAEQAFYLAAKSFNLAEKYQIPVFIMVDQYLADSLWTTLPLELSRIVIDRGELLPADTGVDYKRYSLTDSGISPRAIPGAGPALVLADSDEHTQEGHITESAQVRNETVQKRLRKLERLRAEIALPESYGPEDASITLLSWGSNRHVLREVVDILNKQQPGQANCWHFTELWPFPAFAVEPLLKRATRLISVENNSTAQFAKLICMETGIRVHQTILKFDGRPFAPEEVVSAVQKEIML